tara:strand:- start:3410 stop:4921 length:1512 start_codon:yes stop_codon:yes gene_type:complete
MAQDPLSMVYGGQIGQGQAQVFDTTDIAKMQILKQEQRQKAFTDSLIDYDATDVWNRDLEGKTINGEYHKGFYDHVNDYKTFLKENRSKLLKPSRYPELQSQKLTLESKIKHIQKTSNSNQKKYLEYQDIINDPKKSKLYDINEEEFDRIGTTPLANVGAFDGIFQKRLEGLSNNVSKMYTQNLNKTTNQVTMDDPENPGQQITLDMTDIDKRSNVVLNEYDNNEVLQGQALEHYERNKDRVFKLPEEVTWVDSNGEEQQGGEFVASNPREYWWANEMSQIPSPGRGTKNKSSQKINLNVKMSSEDKTEKFNFGQIESGTNLYEGYEVGNITYTGGKGSKVMETLTFKGKAISLVDGEERAGKLDNATIHGTVLDENDNLFLHVSTKTGGIDYKKLDRKVNNAQSKYDQFMAKNPDGHVKCYGTEPGCGDKIAGRSFHQHDKLKSTLDKAISERDSVKEKSGGIEGQVYLIPIEKGLNETLLQDILGTDYTYEQEINRYDNLD